MWILLLTSTFLPASLSSPQWDHLSRNGSAGSPRRPCPCKPLSWVESQPCRGLYFFLHAAAYAHSELHLSGPTAIAIYYGYTAAASAALSLVTGGVSFVASFWFVRSIFAAVKVD